jgi:hypothetical protein
VRSYVDTPHRAKRYGKHLKRLLCQCGYDFRLTICQNLIAQMFGYTSFNELHRIAGSMPHTLKRF